MPVSPVPGIVGGTLEHQLLLAQPPRRVVAGAACAGLPGKGVLPVGPGPQHGQGAGDLRSGTPMAPGVAAPAPTAEGGAVAEHYDVIIIGTGAGGGTLAHALAGSGKKILLLERGNFLPREMGNWDPKNVFVEGRYISPDTWYDGDGKPFQPQVHYFVGGATKLYGAALYRDRK